MSHNISEIKLYRDFDTLVNLETLQFDVLYIYILSRQEDLRWLPSCRFQIVLLSSNVA